MLIVHANSQAGAVLAAHFMGRQSEPLLLHSMRKTGAARNVPSGAQAISVNLNLPGAARELLGQAQQLCPELRHIIYIIEPPRAPLCPALDADSWSQQQVITRPVQIARAAQGIDGLESLTLIAPQTDGLPQPFVLARAGLLALVPELARLLAPGSRVNALSYDEHMDITAFVNAADYLRSAKAVTGQVLDVAARDMTCAREGAKS